MNKSTLLNAIIIVAVAFFIGWCSRSPSLQEWRAKYGLYRDSVNLVIRQNVASRKSLDSLRALARQDSIAAEQWKARSERLNSTVALLHAANDSLRKELPTDLSACDSVLVCANMHKLANGLSVEVDSLRQQNAHLASAYASEVQETGRLRLALSIANRQLVDDSTQMAKLPPPPPQEKLLGLIPLPSRTASFFIGAGATAVTAIVVSHVHH